MTHGFDTSFMVAAELAEHPDHGNARAILRKLTDTGDRFAISPQVIAEFVHVVTDSRRFLNALDVTTALRIGNQWWNAADVDQLFPSAGAIELFFEWMGKFHLGRKRILDTMLAATLRTANVRSLLTRNANDFVIFDCFSLSAL